MPAQVHSEAPSRSGSSAAVDLIVVGGGPAGSTLAALVKKYDPSREVVLLEKAPGPRHHIGESLQPGVNLVLKELGAYEEVERAGFVRKRGAVYVWGKDRKPWENDFSETRPAALGGGGAAPTTWQVRRSRYDEILLRNAERLGVRVVRGAQALSLLEEGERIVGVVCRGAGGEIEERRCGLLADCSGQNGFLSKFRRVREFNPDLKNVAAYSYFRGARWKFRYSGSPNDTRTFLCSTARGWIWYIPIERDLISVGFVTTVERVKKCGVDIAELYADELRNCAEIRSLLKGAERVENFDGTGQGFFTQNDWSYMNVAASGPGWLAAGDAALFVDPILSSGVLLAHLGAQRAAYTLLTHWKSADAGASERLWRDYDGFCREFAAQFLSLALFWYGNDRNAAKWWAQAREIQKALLPAALPPKTAFITVSTGLSQYYQRLRSAETLVSDVPTRLEDQPFYESVLKGSPPRSKSSAKGVPRLLHPYEVEYAFQPIYGSGVLRPVKRVRFLKRASKAALSDVFNPKRIVSRYHLDLLECIDGVGDMESVRKAAAARGVPAGWLAGPARTFLDELALHGVLEFAAVKKGRRRKA